MPGSTAAVLCLLLSFSSLSATQLAFTEVPTDITVEVGTTLTLRCVAEVEGNLSAGITYSWLKDGLPAPGQQIRPGQLVIESPTVTDAGSYVCVAESGTFQIESEAAIVMVTEGSMTAVIAISVSVAVVFLVLLSIVICVWILLCSHRSHIWDKAPMRPHVRHNVLYEEEEIEGYSPKTLPKRSISLSHLRPTNHQAAEGHITKSFQDLLYGSQPTEATDLQDDLDLDETMFEKTLLSHDKVHSENDINKPSTSFPHLTDKTQQLLPPIDKISEKCDKQGDSHHGIKGQGSRRASNSSYLSDAQSDFSSDFVASQASSSLLKSVRFDIDEDLEPDSGVVTGTSTPHHPERRASAPEFKATSSVVRRGSAPECKTVSFSGEGNRGDSSDAVDSDPEGEGRIDSFGYSIDKMSTFAESSNIGEKRVTEEWDVQTDSDMEVSSLQARNHETANLSSAQVEGADSPTTKREANDHTPPTVTIATDQRHSSPRKIAQLISAAEQWRSALSGVAEGRPMHEVSQQRVAHMRKMFQQQQLHTVEKNTPVTKQLSKLVTEKAKVFQRHAHQEERLSVVKDPPKMRVLLEESKEVEGGSSPMSPKLGASPPQLDLSDESEGGEGKEDGNGTQNGELGPDIDESNVDLSNHNNSDENNKEEEEEEEDIMTRFERSRLSTSIPVFTCPVNLSPWQPIHLTENDEEADSSGDEDICMVQPLRPQTGLVSISPFGKGLLSQQSRSPFSPQVKFQLPGMRETKRIQHPALEPFYRPQGFQKTAAVNRLSSIPEETPEMCSSTHNVLS